MKRFEDPFFALLLILSVASAIVVGRALLVVLAFEARGPINEYGLYTIVGRGILNGLKPYVDLFETKPPGMFLLAALSLFVSNNELVAIVMELGFLLLFPVTLTLLYLHRSSAQKLLKRAPYALLVFCLGTLLSLYLEEHSGFLQTELFGSLFVCLYLLTLTLELRETPWLLLLRGLLLMLAIGMKETFLVASIAAAVLILRDPVECIRKYFLPLAIALVLGSLGLLVLGWIQPFLQVYLPAVVQYRAAKNPDPFFIRGFHIYKPLVEMTTFATAPYRGYAIVTLWILSSFFRSERHDWKTLLCSGVALWAAGYSFIYLYDSTQILKLAKYHLVTINSGIVWFMGMFAFFITVLAVFLWITWKFSKTLFVSVIFSILGLYLISATIGAGFYSVYHFAAGFPFYAALSLLFVRYLSRTPHPGIVAPVVTIILIASITYTTSITHLLQLEGGIRQSFAANRGVAAQVDALLTDCHFERYYGFGTFFDLAYTHHSPMGPLPDLDNFSDFSLDHPLIAQTIENVMSDTPVVFAKCQKFSGYDQIFYEGVKGKYSKTPVFTATPPPCAVSHLPIQDYDVFFRISPRA